MEDLIAQLWADRQNIHPDHTAVPHIKQVLALLDRGEIRVCEKIKGTWQVHEWVKQAILLSFRIFENQAIPEYGSLAYDKIPLKFSSWTENDFKNARIRAVPGSIVRYTAHIRPEVVLMPSFVNVGAYVGENTMVDTWVTIGSCAQIGKNCHISGGVGIGGVLEPLQAKPVVIEDNCFIGARSEVVEGVVIEEGAVLGMGVYLASSTPIYDRESGQISHGRVPPYSVVLPGTLPGKVHSDGSRGPGLYCAVIVKKVDEKTRAKTAINDLLRPM